MEKVVSVPIMEFLQDKVQERVAQKEWMKERTFKLAESVEEVMDFVDKAIEVNLCALDLETSGLSTRVRNIDGKQVPVERIIGFCVSYDSKVGMYIPINHLENDGQANKPSEYNLPEKQIFAEIKRLCANCVTIYHNAKFDLAFLKNYGIVVDSFQMFEDTLLLAYLNDSGQKDISLKSCSPRYLDQPMLEFNEICGTSSSRFDLVCPSIAYLYGGSDAVCTLDLYNYLIKQDIVKSQQLIYTVEKRVTIALMEMEGNLIKINKECLEGMQVRATARLKVIESEIYELAGHEFNIGSTQQLGKVLFVELGYSYSGKKTASGQFMTDSKTLEKISDQYPVVKKIVEFRKLTKLLGTYIGNLIKNCDEDGCVKLAFKQTGTDTGRFSSPGGKGLLIDGMAGVNVQAIPKEPSEDNPDLDMRECFVARPGKTIVAIDYENEEMRIATNLANETTWIDAVNNGVDFHTATAAIISGKEAKDVVKAERKIGKTVNFLALYLGGPQTLSNQAKVTVPEAKKILSKYFAGVPNLRKWIDNQIKLGKKRKFVKTIFGRTRLLGRFYAINDKALESHGDRCVINTQIQGAAADIMKLVMSKLYTWVHRNNLQDEIKTLITMHDELVFEIPTEKLELYVPELCKIMMFKEVITDRLKWEIPLTVDVQYGDTWRVKEHFFNDYPHCKDRLNEPLREFVNPEDRVDSVLEEKSAESPEEAEKQVIPETQDVVVTDQNVEEVVEKVNQVEEIVLEEPRHVEPEIQDVVLPESKEKSDVYVYQLQNLKEPTLRFLNSILNHLLEEVRRVPGTSTKILKLRSPDGYSLTVADMRVNVESFLVLVKFFGI